MLTDLTQVREALEIFKETHPKLDSVAKILETYATEDAFVEAHADEFPGGSRDARQVYRTALDHRDQAILLWGSLQDAIAPHYRQTLFNNLPTELPAAFIEQQNAIPGYDKLFQANGQLKSLDLGLQDLI